MTAFLDAIVLVRYLTGDSPDLTPRATAYLTGAEDLLLTDVIVAEVVFVLASNYGYSRALIADRLTRLIDLPSIVVDDARLLARALEVYDVDRIDFAEAYLVAAAERGGVGVIASFDRSLDRVATISRLEPR